jgi:hypothetical protein
MMKNLIPFLFGMVAGALAISLFPLITLLIVAAALVAAYLVFKFIVSNLAVILVFCGILVAGYFALKMA